MINDGPGGCRGVGIAGIVPVVATLFIFALYLVLFQVPAQPGVVQPGVGQPGGAQPGVGQPGGAQHAALEELDDSFVVGGSATTSVSGALTVSEQIAADTLRSSIQDGKAWLGFGSLRGGTGATEVLIVLNEPEDSVTVAQGELAAIGQDDDCTWSIEVASSTISGTVSCATVEVWRNTTEPTGTTASIQLQFSTTLTPMGEEE